MGIFEWLNKKRNKDKREINDLIPFEQDEVNKGVYEPHNFEEDELEDDDYYFEDDN